MQEPYEPPELTAVGSVRDLTMGDGIFGHDDTFVFHWGPFDIPIHWGNNS